MCHLYISDYYDEESQGYPFLSISINGLLPAPRNVSVDLKYDVLCL